MRYYLRLDAVLAHVTPLTLSGFPRERSRLVGLSDRCAMGLDLADLPLHQSTYLDVRLSCGMPLNRARRFLYLIVRKI